MKTCLRITLGAATLIASGLWSTAFAADVALNGGQFVIAEPTSGNTVLTVKGPGNFQFIAQNGKLQFRPKSSIDPKSLVDGFYAYEIREYKLGSNRTVTDLANGRYRVKKRNSDNAVIRSGKVMIKGGEIVFVDSSQKEG